MNPAARADQIRQETYGKAFTCSRCRSRVDGIHNEDHEAVLTTLGWHLLHDLRFCSKGCLEWYQVLGRQGAPVAAVDQLADRAYQLRRAQLGNLPASAPPVALPKPVRR